MTDNDGDENSRLAKTVSAADGSMPAMKGRWCWSTFLGGMLRMQHQCSGQAASEESNA